MATANGSAAGATPAQRDLQSILFRGHRIYVWRQPEPTKHAFAWRVVLDTDQRDEIAVGEVDLMVEAWGAAQAAVPGAETCADIERRDRLTFGRDYPMLDFSAEVARLLPDLPRRLEKVHRCAYGLDAIARLLRAADLRRDQFELGNDVEILQPYTAGGLHYAAEALVDVIMRETEALSDMEVRHG